MRRWTFAWLLLLGIGCSGTASGEATPLHKLCVDACAHVRAKNCYAAPAVGVDLCSFECSDVQSKAGTPCTDEHAALYECTAKADITCEGATGETPVVNGCSAQEAAIEACETPGLACVRAPSSDETCFQFGFKQFFACSEGVNPGPECLPVTITGFCCP